MPLRYSKTEHVVEREVRNTLMLIPMHTGPARLDALYTLNETAGFLWKAITPGTTEEDLVARLLSEYSVPEAAARQDVRRILDRLTQMGAVVCARGE